VDVERFKDVKAFKSYMGLGLRIYQSGKKEKNEAVLISLEI